MTPPGPATVRIACRPSSDVQASDTRPASTTCTAWGGPPGGPREARGANDRTVPRTLRRRRARVSSVRRRGRGVGWWTALIRSLPLRPGRVAPPTDTPPRPLAEPRRAGTLTRGRAPARTLDSRFRAVG